MFDYKNAEKILEAEDVVVKFNLRGKPNRREQKRAVYGFHSRSAALSRGLCRSRITSAISGPILL